MHIERIHIKGYKRLLLADIDEITIDYNSLYQLILGTNGSGKSSLLEELTPLPPTPADFRRDGYKIVECHHNGHHYVASSYFGTKNEHYLTKDGEILNDGGNSKVQKDWVANELGLTDEYHDLLVGNVSFTNMAPSKRREWMTKMSNTDMTYALGVFKRLQSRVRDEQGALKHLKGRLAQEQDRHASLSVEDDIEATVYQLQQELTTLMQERRTDIETPDEVDQRLQRYLSEAQTLSQAILDNALPYTLTQEFGSPEQLTESLEASYREYDKLESQSSTLIDEYEHLSRLTQSLSHEGVGDVGELTAKRQQLMDELEQYRQSIQQFHFEGDVEPMIEQAQMLKSQLMEVLSELGDNSDRRFSRHQLKEIDQQIDECQRQQTRIRSAINQCEHRLGQMGQVEVTVCPSCGHQWREGASDEAENHLKKEMGKYEKELQSWQQKHDSLHEKRQAIEQYAYQFQRFKGLKDHYLLAQNLFDYLLEEDRILYQPAQYAPVIETWISDLHRHRELMKRRQEIERLDEVIEQSKMLNDTSGQSLREALTRMDQQQADIQEKQRGINERIKELEAYKEQMQYLNSCEQRLHELSDAIYRDQALMYEALRHSGLGELIQSQQSTLALANQRLQEKQSLEQTIEQLKQQIEEVTERHKNAQLLADMLSPFDGLIAEQMTRFIECVVTQMNEIIEQIYTYPLEVVRCGIESDELDYKFPLSVGVDRIPVKDIGNGSLGQQEIIDFAFRVVALMYLGFQDYPLYIDELGRHQDEQHLTNVMHYLKLLVEANRHTQLFMISHTAPFHGAFTQAEVCVLSHLNVAVPSESNQHVVIN